MKYLQLDLAICISFQKEVPYSMPISKWSSINHLTVRDFENKVESGNINMKSPTVSSDKKTTSLTSKVKMLRYLFSPKID